MDEATFCDMYFRGEMVRPDRMMNLPAVARYAWGRWYLARHNGQYMAADRALRLVAMCADELAAISSQRA